MIVYMITAKKVGKNEEIYPELTCSDYMAHLRYAELEKEGYIANITQYELKTQGKNWHTIAHPFKFIA